ncbi:MAG: hypothetical protein IPN91_10800 [Holophagaceae bacterium]|uniref:Uncharacterized protein n=1 Tax=Candidatus Geothrix odensensis TaxID=2954440 RepID=A0A936F345_9BACT|nr:hypothetical protein [Candidatus Geothrix odensensis]
MTLPASPPHRRPGGHLQVPDDSAPSRRVLALARLLDAAGARPLIGAADPTPDLRPREGPAGDLPVVHLSELPQKTTPRLIQALRQFVWGGRACAWLEGLDPRPAAVLLYGGYSPFALWLLRFRRRTGIPVLVDAVEWYQPSHVPGGPLGPFHLMWNGPSGACSPPRPRHLHQPLPAAPLRGQGLPHLYLPAVLDVAAIEPDLAPRPASAPLRLAYTGTPGKKDLLDPMVEALLRLDPQGERIRFAIVGPSPAALLQLPALRRRGLSELPPGLEAPGQVTNAEALAQVRRADFSVLLRHRQRYAMAGFPTKVPESLAVGTPVLCNLTSDRGTSWRMGCRPWSAPSPPPRPVNRPSSAPWPSAPPSAPTSDRPPADWLRRNSIINYINLHFVSLCRISSKIRTCLRSLADSIGPKIQRGSIPQQMQSKIEHKPRPHL